MSFGQTLRAAREAKGLTASELAATTHILVQIIEGLENEDFRKIPAPIYGRGFVKLYCEAVGIDPKPMQAEFMAIYNQSKNAGDRPKPQPVRKPEAKPPEPEPKREPEMEREPATTLPADLGLFAEVAPEPKPETEPAAEIPPEPVEETEPEPFVETEPEPVEETEPEPEPEEEMEPAATPSAPTYPERSAVQAPRRSYGELFEQSYAAEAEQKQSAAEKFRNTMSNVSSGVFSNVKRLPRNTWRIVAASAAAILIIALMAWGVVELYKATTPSGDSAPEAPAAVTKKPEAQAKQQKQAKPQQQAKPAAKPTKKPETKPGKLKSSGIAVPPLYID